MAAVSMVLVLHVYLFIIIITNSMYKKRNGEENARVLKWAAGEWMDGVVAILDEGYNTI